jgi:hypothetical protein
MASVSFDENSPLGDVLKVSQGSSASDWISKWKDYCLEVKDALLIRPVTFAVAGILSSFKAEANEDALEFVSILEEIPNLPPTVLFEWYVRFTIYTSLHVPPPHTRSSPTCFLKAESREMDQEKNGQNTNACAHSKVFFFFPVSIVILDAKQKLNGTLHSLYNFYLFIDKSKARELALTVLSRALKAAHSKHLPTGDAFRNLVLQDMDEVPVEESSNMLAHLVLCSFDDHSLILKFLGVKREEWGSGLKDAEKEALFRLICDAVKKSDTDLLRKLWKSSFMIPLKENEGNVFELLRIFVNGDMEAFEAFLKGVPSTFFDGVKVPLKEDCQLSMSLLDLLKMLEHLPVTLTYEEVAKGLRIQVEDIEETLVEAVSRGLVALKMDQVNAKITFLSKSLRQFDEKEWRHLKDRVESYRKRIARVKDVLESVRQGGRA